MSKLHIILVLLKDNRVLRTIRFIFGVFIPIFAISYFQHKLIPSSSIKNISIRRLITVGKSCLFIQGKNLNLLP